MATFTTGTEDSMVHFAMSLFRESHPNITIERFENPMGDYVEFRIRNYDRSIDITHRMARTFLASASPVTVINELEKSIIPKRDIPGKLASIKKGGVDAWAEDWAKKNG